MADPPRHICGEYGPEFLGFGAVPPLPLWRRALPWLWGAAVGIAALSIEMIRAA